MHEVYLDKHFRLTILYEHMNFFAVNVHNTHYIAILGRPCPTVDVWIQCCHHHLEAGANPSKHVSNGERIPELAVVWCGYILIQVSSDLISSVLEDTLPGGHCLGECLK